jgi:NAD(P)-dependent dehydrogenase (short-subunit alcohol dehydrogenase family)
MSAEGSLAGKVALVTGASSGIGAATARALAGAGAQVIVNSRSSAEAGQAVAKEVGGHYLQADVSVPEAAADLVARAVDLHGQLDILVNNAGTTEVIPHHDLAAATPEIWHRLYATNVVAPFVMITAALDALSQAQGVVVNTGSLAGVRPTGSSVPYAASKAALHHMSLLLAATFGPTIRVNVVAPGLVATPWTADWAGPRAYYEQVAPMKREASPEDVAGAILYLVSAPYLTGEVLIVDGGMQLR